MIVKNKGYYFHYHINTHMIANLRRSARENDYLPITVSARNGHTGTTVSGSLPGHIINISRHGACLFMSRVMAGGFHIFHSTREDQALLLRLDITVPPDDSLFIFTAVPHWFDLLQNDLHRGFKIGVEFSPPPEEERMKQFQQAIKIQQKERARQFHP